MSHMMLRAGAVAAVGLIGSSLCLLDASPLSGWVAGHVWLGNAVVAINLPGIAAALAVTRAHSPASVWFVLGMAAEWVVIGFIAAWVWGKLWPNNSSKPTPLRGAA